MQKLISLLSGKKAYLVCGVTVLYAILGYSDGRFDFDTAMQMVLGAAGLGALRAGVSKGK